MSRRWRSCRRGLGEDQGPVTLPLHVVKRLSAVGLWVRVSLEKEKETPTFSKFAITLYFSILHRNTRFYFLPWEHSFNLCICTICCL